MISNSDIFTKGRYANNGLPVFVETSWKTISNPLTIYMTEGRIPAQMGVLKGYTPEQVRARQVLQAKKSPSHMTSSMG
jgi:hypothetical protein